MKNVLFGLAVGVVVGYVLRRMEDQGQFECLENELHGLTDKAKKKVKDVVDTGKNQVEYVKDRVEHMVENLKVINRPPCIRVRKRSYHKKVNDSFFFFHFRCNVFSNPFVL